MEKNQISWDFQSKFTEKLADFWGIWLISGEFAEKQSVKNDQFHGNVQGKFCEK